MYQTKVEQVDGWRVRAGGKWLQCIGNKKVRVGDLIWTDGRCVYGYEKESMQPPIIISPTGDIEIIPLLVKDESTFRFFSLPKNYKEIYSLQTESYAQFTTNNSKKIFKFDNDHDADEQVFTINIDSRENRYALSYFRKPYSERFGDVYLKKNGIILQKFNLDDIGEPLYKEGLIYENTYGLTKNSIVFWGSVENESRWAFVVRILAGITSLTGYRYTPDFHETHTLRDNIYLYTPNGIFLLVESSFDAFVVGENSSSTSHYDMDAKETNEQIPLQNDYFLVINKLTPTPVSYASYIVPSIILRCVMANMTIYSPKRVPLLTLDVPLDTKLLVHENLIGIKNGEVSKNMSANLYSLPLTWNRYALWDNGLYIVENSQLFKIIDGLPLNENLKPIKLKKSQKNWYNFIRNWNAAGD